MKSLFCVFIAVMTTLVAIMGCTSSRNAELPLPVMSFNIRYANTYDGPNAWSNRKDAVVRMLQEVRPAILGIQEGLHEQVVFLDSALFGYAYVGVGRDDGSQAGEYAAIFFDADRFEKLDAGNFWLSATPEIPSMGWDAVCIRIATWVKLKERSTGRKLLTVNTHFDHIGRQARANSARMLADSITSLGDAIPVVVMGDFNSAVDDPALEVLVNHPLLREAKSEAEASAQGPDYTYMGFEDKPADRALIDHIFVKSFEVAEYKVITDSYGIKQLSDHLPVFALLKYN